MIGSTISAVLHLHPIPLVEIASLELSQPLTDSPKLNLIMGDIIYGQDVYFLGFPYGMSMKLPQDFNKGYPFPLVKKGIFSTLPEEVNDLRRFFLDGMNNPGFSEGPCLHIPEKLKAQGRYPPNICGIIKGYVPIP
jgi:hypothetical protein